MRRRTKALAAVAVPWRLSFSRHSNTTVASVREREHLTQSIVHSAVQHLD